MKINKTEKIFCQCIKNIQKILISPDFFLPTLFFLIIFILILKCIDRVQIFKKGNIRISTS